MTPGDGSDGSRSLRAVLLVDLVESVRLLQNLEAQTITRWERLVARVRTELLTSRQGTLVRSLGDGLLLTFERLSDACDAAAAILDAIGELNQGFAPEHSMALRIGLHRTDWVVGALDIYGPGVNLCARLASLAGPQALVCSAETLALLRPGLGPPWECQDLGPCHLKHIDGAVHCWQLSRGGSAQKPMDRVLAMRPCLAVLPLQIRDGDPLPQGAAEVLRDDLVRALAMHRQWQVISRLSTQNLTQAQDLPTAGAQAHFWVRGELGGSPLGAMLDISFLEGEQELWSGHYEMPWQQLLAASGLVARIAQAIDQALLRQGALAEHRPALPTLPSYALLLRALQGLHRLRPDAMAEARGMLEHLAERHPRASDVQAWLAKWHFVHLCQLQSSDPQRTAEQIRQSAQQALQHEPGQGLALALQGQLRAFHERDAEGGYLQLREASRLAPNEALGWIYLANLQAMRGEPEALQSYRQGQALSPLDPLGYEFDLMGSIAQSAVGERAEALRLARRSVQRNGSHLAGQVQLIIALVECDAMDEARQVAKVYVARRPQASVQRFIDLHIAGQRPIVQRQAQALLAAGLPR